MFRPFFAVTTAIGTCRIDSKLVVRYLIQRSIVIPCSIARSHLFTTKMQGLNCSEISSTNCLSTREIVRVASKNISTRSARRILRCALTSP